MKSWIQQTSLPGLHIGDATNLAREYAVSLRNELIDEMKQILIKSFPEYGISLDGTPSFAEAECIMLRFVTKSYNIVEIIVRFALYNQKLNANQLTNHLLSTIHQRLGLVSSDWLAVQLDRAGTNSAALLRLNDQLPHIRPQKNFCASHGLNNVCKKITEATKHTENYRLHWQSIIQHSSKCREYVNKKFSRKVITSRGGG